MSRNAWRFLLVVFVTAWALYEMYPPTPRDLFKVFEERAEVVDTNFTAIIQKARELEKKEPKRPYLHLLAAAGTNDLSRYFPSLLEEDYADRPVEEKNRQILHAIQRLAAGQIKLGLDLQGGVSFLVSLDTNRLSKAADKQHALQQAVEVLRRRVDKFGVAEPIIQPVGENRILIQLPGLSEAEKESARRQIQRAAFLEFRMVHPESDQLLREGIIEPGYEVLVEKKRKGRDEPPHAYLVEKKPAMGLTGKYVRRANVFLDPTTGEPKISLQFNSEGGRIFGELTSKNVGRLLAIVLDGQLYSAPRINEPILGGTCEISGDFDLAEAQELANVLQNPLEAPVHIEEERSVDPTLGRDSIRSGVEASILGLLLVCIFMLVYYMFAGLVANVALFMNLILLLGVLCAVDATLTLPGIAGVVLTVGMAVDANVLIFERIREELREGKSFRGALAAGYDKAFSTILDANVTTLIASVILINLGTGPVKGFGVTLTIGICASMFTALVVTRLIFDFLIDRGYLKGLKMLTLIRNPKIDFLRFAKGAFILSWCVILVGWLWGVHRGMDVFGVDFKGGDQLGLRFEQKVDVSKIRKLAEGLGIGDVRIQYQKELGAGKETLVIVSKAGAGRQVEEALKKAFPKAGFMRVSLDEVGGAIGREIQRTAIVAVLLALFGMLVYVAFRYEFSFATGAVLAVIHDVLMTMGFLFLSGRQLSAPIVAALLTIMGYSINDTIVIFDRIREDLKLGARGTFREIINQALNKTLSRTLITSGTTFLSTLSLYIFGGGAINDFAFCFLVGIITGTYSSVYIASALVLWWHKGRRPRMATSPVQTGAPAPASAGV